MKNALIYCRVSTEEQAKEGYSLDAQEKICNSFLKQKGYRIKNVYKDKGKSATTLNRPALKDLLGDCQEDKSINAVVVQDTDRLARNTKDHLTIKAILQKAGIKLISISQPMLDDSAEGKMIDTILASVNQFQSDINGRKTKKGLQEKFNQGWWPGWAPLGYLNKEIKEKRIVIPDPEKWKIIRKGFKEYLTGNYSVVEIAEKLHKKGLRSKSGKKVSYSIMTHILRNPFYAGLMRWKNQEKIGKHKSMITLEEHNRVLSIMKAHRSHACRRRKHNFLLRGFVFCDICGQRYTADRHRAGKISDYYHCSARSIQHSNKNQNVKTNDLEKQVEEQFRNIQFSQDFINLVIEKVKKFYQEKKKEDKKEKKVLLNKKIKIERRREKAEEKLIAGTLDDEDFIRIRDRIKEKSFDIQERINELEKKHDVDIDTIREALILTKNIYKAYKKAPYEIKRLYLAFFWDKIWVRDKKVVRVQPTKLIDALVENKKIFATKSRRCLDNDFRLRTNWLP
jgi:DNA invertase Pin-like site-specific DNA recombinase